MNDFAYASNVFARHAATAFVSLRLDARGFVVGQRVGDDVFALEKQFFESVSYTHLTLPTKRIV